MPQSGTYSRVLAAAVLGCCLSQGAPGAVLSSNYTVNGSFESGLAGWQKVWGRCSLSTTESRDGSQALQIVDGGAVSTPLIPFVPGVLAYSLWIRTAEIAVGKNPYNVAVVQVTGFSADHGALRHWDLCQVKGTTDWHEISGTLDLGQQTDVAYLKIHCMVWNTTGTAWFDDLRIGPRYSGPSPDSLAHIQLPQARPYPDTRDAAPIIPAPQQVQLLDTRFALVPETPLYLGKGIRETAKQARSLWRELLLETCGPSAAAEQDLPQTGLPARSVVFASFDEFTRLAQSVSLPGQASQGAEVQHILSVPIANSEGYRLLVTADTVLVGARDDAGFLHAVQTLRCLLKPVRPGVASVSGVAVSDWPDLDWRGMYLSMWYGPGSGGGCDLGLLQRMIRNILAAGKMNALLLQVDNTMRYRSHPELGGLYSAEEMRDLVDFCRSYGVEVIPLIQSFGHNHYFVFGGGKRHTELAENERQYSVCPKHPGTLELFTDLYDEIIEVFEPRYLHIGCDEVGPIGVCERCKDTPKWQLFGDYINTLRDYLAGRGVRTMIWGDYLLDPERFPGSSYCHGKETWKALDILNKDIVICDWHYHLGVGPQHDYPTTAALHDLGFPVIGVPATYSRLNNATYARYLERNGLTGMFSSVWASIHNWKGIKGYPERMGGMLDAAEYAWSVDSPATDRPAPYDAEALALARTRPASAIGSPGFLVDLRQPLNAALPTTAAAFPFGRHTLGGIRFRTLDPVDQQAGRWCIALGSSADLPDRVPDLPLARKADSLAFLQAWVPTPAGKVENWETLGWYEVVYEDSETLRIPIVSGLHVAPLLQGTPRRLYGSSLVKLPDNHAAYVREWQNPRPEIPIHHLNMLRNPSHEGDLYLLAMTGLNNPPPLEAPPVPGVSATLLEGFGAIAEAAHSRGYASYRGESVQSWLAYATDGTEAVTWTTTPLPAVLPPGQISFAIACGLGSGAGDAPHQVSVNGRQVLTIGTPNRTDAGWQGDGATAFFDYITHDQWDSFGVLYLTVDADLLRPGQPATLSVRGTKADSKSWFMLHRYTDTLTYNLFQYGHGLVPPAGNNSATATTPPQR